MVVRSRVLTVAVATVARAAGSRRGRSTLWATPGWCPLPRSSHDLLSACPPARKPLDHHAASGWYIRRDDDGQDAPTRPALFSVLLHPCPYGFALTTSADRCPRVAGCPRAPHAFKPCLCGVLLWTAPRTGERQTGGSGGGIPREGRTSTAVNPALGPGTDAKGLLASQRRTKCLVSRFGALTVRR